MKNLRILHLLSQRPDSTGSGIYVQAMIREAAVRGDDNFLIAGADAGWGKIVEAVLPEKTLFVRFNGADLACPMPGMSDVMPYPSTRFSDLSRGDLQAYEKAFTGKLQTAVEAFRPDILHTHHLWIVSALARRLFPKIPMVATCHGSDLRQFQNCPHLKNTVLGPCRNIDRIMALSRAQKDEIIRLYDIRPEKITVTGAGYDGTLFYPGTKPDPDPVQLVYAGKLSSAKGVPWLLRALQGIHAPPWQLHLLGDGTGEEKAKCIALAEKLGERVHVHGALSQRRLAEITRQAHILVLPSFYEGLPLVILEGLAGGCRIVATDLPGTRELLGGTESDFIRLVQTPRLRLVDQPFPEEEKAFEKDLKAAVAQQIDAAAASPEIDLSPVKGLLYAYTWSGIFRNVRRVYLDCMQ